MGFKLCVILGYFGLLGLGFYGWRRGMGGMCCYVEDEGKVDMLEWLRVVVLVDWGGRISELSCGWVIGNCICGDGGIGGGVWGWDLVGRVICSGWVCMWRVWVC